MKNFETLFKNKELFISMFNGRNDDIMSKVFNETMHYLIALYEIGVRKENIDNLEDIIMKYNFDYEK